MPAPFAFHAVSWRDEEARPVKELLQDSLDCAGIYGSMKEWVSADDVVHGTPATYLPALRNMYNRREHLQPPDAPPLYISEREHPEVVAATRKLAIRMQALIGPIVQRQDAFLQSSVSASSSSRACQRLQPQQSAAAGPGSSRTRQRLQHQQAGPAQQLKDTAMKQERLQAISDIFAGLEKVCAWLRHACCSTC